MTTPRVFALQPCTSLLAMFTYCYLQATSSGRAGGNRTPNRRFWRPPLCQLSYCPSHALRATVDGVDATPHVIDKSLSNDFGDDTGADGFTALADGEAQSLLH